MKGYESGTYGDRIAEVYDSLHAAAFDTAATVEMLRWLVERGPVLELGVGTGRVAVALAAAGLEVHGVDVSAAMIAELRARGAGPGRVETTVADVVGLDLKRRFEVVYVVGNTIVSGLTRADQAAWFATARRHLDPDGKFVVESFVPDQTLFDRGSRIQAGRVAVDHVVLIAARNDAAEQLSSAQHAVLMRDAVDLFPVRIRHAPPAELDLIARRAGFELAARWGSWRAEPFEPSSMGHVSVYNARAR